jgi:hypothetical protein
MNVNNGTADMRTTETLQPIILIQNQTATYIYITLLKAVYEQGSDVTGAISQTSQGYDTDRQTLANRPKLWWEAGTADL